MESSNILNEEYTAEPEHANLHGGSPAAPSIPKTAPADSNELLQSQWDSELWTVSILQKDFVVSSKAKLDLRVSEFLSQCNETERESLQTSRIKVLDIIQDAKEAHYKRFPTPSPGSERNLVEKIKFGCKAASETAYEYSQILDVMVGQAPEYVALAYGAIKILLVIQINYQEMKKQVEQYMGRIKTKFDMIDHLTHYIPTARLVDAISRIYDLFTRFLAKAVKYYSQNRAKSYLKSLAKPWKKLEDIVISIEANYITIKDIAQFHNGIICHTNLAVSQANLTMSNNLSLLNQETLSVVKQLSERVEAISVKLSKQSDIAEVASLLQQRMDESFDHPSKIELRSTDGEIQQDDATTRRDPTPAQEMEQLSRLLGDSFIELREFNQATEQHQRVLEQLPEMQAYRSQQCNILKTEKVLSWVESGASQLLWIDGNRVLERSDFNTLFAVPLLILGESTYESVLILRHFCSNSYNTRMNGYRTLVQALLFQLFKQHPTTLKQRITALTRERTSDMTKLWEILAECIREVNADCTFLVIDGIDHLQADGNKSEADEREIVLENLDSLVKDSKALVKILLAASLAHDKPRSVDAQTELIALSSRHQAQPRRNSSFATTQLEFALFPQKRIDIQERRCQKVSFAQLWLLFPLWGIIYTFKDDDLEAFVVAELSGMEIQANGICNPLKIRAWSIDHNGQHFVKRYHNLSIAQFQGEKDITSLKYIPTGYLPHEAKERAKLIDRGRAYWRLGRGVHYKQFQGAGGPVRVVIDQRMRPKESYLKDESDEELNVAEGDKLKPPFLITCRPTISAYILQELNWTSIRVTEVEDITFQHSILDRLLVPQRTKGVLKALLSSHMSQNAMSSHEVLMKKSKLIQDSGRGQVILLHGAPGVGKTFTAICIAESIQRPLLQIVAAEFGNGSKELESTLKKRFQLAQSWGAILLLDDADAFLAQRTSTDLGRNTIVSVFLGVLESFEGIIFLTTNRVEDFDDAFKSRIHITLYYPPLDDIQTIELWAIEIQRARERLKAIEIDEDQILAYARLHFQQRYGQGIGWNGRQIRNAFQSAIALAQFEALGKPVRLEVSHFEIIAKSAAEFDASTRDHSLQHESGNPSDSV